MKASGGRGADEELSFLYPAAQAADTILITEGRKNVCQICFKV